MTYHGILQFAISYDVLYSSVCVFVFTITYIEISYLLTKSNAFQLQCLNRYERKTCSRLLFQGNRVSKAAKHYNQIEFTFQDDDEEEENLNRTRTLTNQTKCKCAPNAQ